MPQACYLGSPRLTKSVIYDLFKMQNQLLMRTEIPSEPYYWSSENCQED